jgi:hypothetical protein
MSLRHIGTYGAGVAIFLTTATFSYAQVSKSARSRKARSRIAQSVSGPSSSASHVAAEVSAGRLNPAASKAGDTVVLKLKDDVKSNGAVVLKKGTPITGVVRNVARSMMGIEWISPATEGKAVQDVSIALHSVTYLTPGQKHEQQNASDLSAGGVRTGSALGLTAAALTSDSSARFSGQSNAAMRSMPSVVAVDSQTSSAIENGLGVSSSGQLFRVGSGQLVTGSGTQQSVDIFSLLDNDTVITSAGQDFVISTGAQMQLLVGVKKR